MSDFHASSPQRGQHATSWKLSLVKKGSLTTRAGRGLLAFVFIIITILLW